MRDSFTRIEASAQDPSAAGDLAMIFNYMKMLDPGSVVRESEFATAQNAGGVDDKTRALYNNVLRGERLAPAQREDFLNRSQQLMQGQTRGHELLISEYTRLATELGVNPEAVVIDYMLEMQGLKREGEEQGGGGGLVSSAQAGASDFGAMTYEQLDAVNPADLDDTQLAAYIAALEAQLAR